MTAAQWRMLCMTDVSSSPEALQTQQSSFHTVCPRDKPTHSPAYNAKQYVLQALLVLSFFCSLQHSEASAFHIIARHYRQTDSKQQLAQECNIKQRCWTTWVQHFQKLQASSSGLQGIPNEVSCNISARLITARLIGTACLLMLYLAA